MLDANFVTKRLLVGSRLTQPQQFRFLQKLGIRAVLSLQSDEDLAVYGLNWDALWTLGFQHGLEMRRYPIKDFNPSALVKSLEGAVEQLDSLVKEFQRVYIHCTAGINRSPSVVLSYLVLKSNIDVDKAHELLTAARPQAYIYEEVIRFLRHKQHSCLESHSHKTQIRE